MPGPINKNKHLENATKHVQRGQLDRAIKELQKILDADPNDIQVRLKTAGLLARAKKPDAALDDYDRVASYYVREGFHARAVAVYELMVKIDPQRIDLHLRLGDLYAQLARRAEALREYQVVATYFDAKGRAAESIEVLRKMAAIGPDNARTRRKLAELMVQQGKVGEAIAELSRLVEALEQKDDLEALADVQDRIAALSPRDGDALRTAARTHLARRDPRRALARLQSAFALDPRHPATLGLLSEAFLLLGNRAKAIAVLRELARAHDRAGRTGERDETWRELLRLDPTDEEAREALDAPIPLTEVSAPDAPEPLIYQGGRRTAGGRPPAPVPGAATAPVTVSRLLEEASVYLRYGLKAKALGLLEAALARDEACLGDRPALAAFHRKVLAGETSVPGDVSAPPPPAKPRFVEVSVEVSKALANLDSTGSGAKALREALDEAEFFVRQELYDEAVEVYRSLFERFPGEKRIRRKLEEAQAALARERAARREPGRELSLDVDGSARFDGGAEDAPQVSVAEVLLEMSGELDVASGEKSDFDLGLTYRDMGLLDEAIASFERAASDPEHAAGARRWIGLCKLDRGDVDGALRTLEKALELASSEEAAAVELAYGNALEAAGRFQEAASLYRRLLEGRERR